MERRRILRNISGKAFRLQAFYRVSRDSEVEQLRKPLEEARSGHGQLVAAVGEPGVGTARLFHKFTHSYRTQDWLIPESGSVSYGTAT